MLLSLHELDLVHFFLLKLVENMLFQVFLRHYDVIEILVEVRRQLRATVLA